METEHSEVFDMDETTKMKWYKIVFALKKEFGKKPDLNGLLFLIGMRELGQTREFTKDENGETIKCKITFDYDTPQASPNTVRKLENKKRRSTEECGALTPENKRLKKNVE